MFHEHYRIDSHVQYAGNCDAWKQVSILIHTMSTLIFYTYETLLSLRLMFYLSAREQCLYLFVLVKGK